MSVRISTRISITRCTVRSLKCAHTPYSAQSGYSGCLRHGHEDMELCADGEQPERSFGCVVGFLEFVTDSLLTPIPGHAAVVLSDDRIMIFGGTFQSSLRDNCFHILHTNSSAPSRSLPCFVLALTPI